MTISKAEENQNGEEISSLLSNIGGYNYIEEDDEDFDPNKPMTESEINRPDGNIAKNDESDESDDDNYSVEEDEKNVDKKGPKKFDYSDMQSEAGGLIKTRGARRLEELNKKRKYESLENTSVSEGASDLWSKLKKQAISRLTLNNGTNSVLSDTIINEQDNNIPVSDDIAEEYIEIERDYKFAGEYIREHKKVLRSSAEGQEYLKNLKFNTTTPSKPQKKNNVDIVQDKDNDIDDNEKKNIRRPLKRPSYLEQIISGAIKPKLTTLEKSQMDWATYVDKEGINEELLLHNKDGYLAKQDFLGRVEMHKDEKYRAFRKKQMELQLQEQQKGKATF